VELRDGSDRSEAAAAGWDGTTGGAVSIQKFSRRGIKRELHPKHIVFHSLRVIGESIQLLAPRNGNGQVAVPLQSDSASRQTQREDPRSVPPCRALPPRAEFFKFAPESFAIASEVVIAEKI
jgi:hypothetical protein